jgi:hypothetical protein
MDVGPEAIQEMLLTGIADRIPGREGAEDEIEPDRRAPGADILDAEVIDAAALEAEELLVGRACRRGNDAQAQAGADPGRTSIAAENAKCIVCPTPAPIGRPLPRGHASIMASGDLLAHI